MRVPKTNVHFIYKRRALVHFSLALTLEVFVIEFRTKNYIYGAVQRQVLRTVRIEKFGGEKFYFDRKCICIFDFISNNGCRQFARHFAFTESTTSTSQYEWHHTPSERVYRFKFAIYFHVPGE